MTLFTNALETSKASPCLCLCNLCVLKYGSWKLFKEYEVVVKPLKSTLLSSQMLKTLDQNDDIQKNNDFVVPGTIRTIATLSKSNGLSE